LLHLSFQIISVFEMSVFLKSFETIWNTNFNEFLKKNIFHGKATLNRYGTSPIAELLLNDNYSTNL
jgi:hypothetical protein